MHTVVPCADVDFLLGPIAVGEAVSASAVNTAIEIKASMIVVLTETGRTAAQVGVELVSTLLECPHCSSADV